MDGDLTTRSLLVKRTSISRRLDRRAPAYKTRALSEFEERASSWVLRLLWGFDRYAVGYTCHQTKRRLLLPLFDAPNTHSFATD